MVHTSLKFGLLTFADYFVVSTAIKKHLGNFDKQQTSRGADYAHTSNKLAIGTPPNPYSSKMTSIEFGYSSLVQMHIQY